MCTKEELEEAAEKGARKVLKEIGLDSQTARDDIKELRNYLQSMRLIKRTFIGTTARILTVSFWSILVIGFISWLAERLHILPPPGQ